MSLIGIWLLLRKIFSININAGPVTMSKFHILAVCVFEFETLLQGKPDTLTDKRNHCLVSQNEKQL